MAHTDRALRARIRQFLVEMMGRVPTETEVDGAIRGYHDQNARPAALDAAGLTPEERIALRLPTGKISGAI